MKSTEYVEELAKKYERYFDIYMNHTVLGSKFELYAEYRLRNEKYILVKSAQLYVFENFEYCFVKCISDTPGMEDLDNFTEFLINAAGEMVKPNEGHMSTYITGVMVCDKSVPDDIIKKARRFKYSKDFLFTLKGWCDVRLIVADLERNKVITNREGKDVKKFYNIQIEK